jgi:hypothetical protein
MSAARQWTRRLIRAAWLERRVSLECAPGQDPVRHIEDVDVPNWFPAKELGLAFDQGPSIIWTTEHLDKINRAHEHILNRAEVEETPRQKVLRRLKLEGVSRRKLVRALARAGILIRNGKFVDARTGRAIQA